MCICECSLDFMCTVMVRGTVIKPVTSSCLWTHTCPNVHWQTSLCEFICTDGASAINVTAADVRRALQKFNLQKSPSPGLDGIPDCEHQLSDVLMDLFNILLSQARVPSCLKTSPSSLCQRPLQHCAAVITVPRSSPHHQEVL